MQGVPGMALLYSLPKVGLTTNGAQQVPAQATATRTIHVVGTFPQGPDYPVLIQPSQMTSTFGDPGAAASQGYSGPYMHDFAVQQRFNGGGATGFQYLVQRLGVTRASYALQDVNAVGTALTLSGIGAYAGSKGNNLQVSVTNSGSPVDQIWTLALSGTGLGGTFTLTLNGVTRGTLNAASMTSAQLQTALTNAFGSGTFTAAGTTWTNTGGTMTITAAGNYRGTVFPNFTVNSGSVTGTITSFTSTISTLGVRPTVQTITVVDSSTGTTLQTYKDLSVAGGLYDLSTNQKIANAINGQNPLTSATSVVLAATGPVLGAPAVITNQALSGGLDGKGAASTVVTQTALAQALWTNRDYMIVGWDAAQVASAVLAHINTDAVAAGQYKKAILGPAAGTSFSALASGYITAGFQSSRLVVVGNDNATAQHPASKAYIQWDGFYLAAAYAGLKASAPADEPCALRPISGFSQLGPSTGKTSALAPSDVLTLAQQGLMVFTTQNGQIVVNDAITTAPYSLDGSTVNWFYQLSVQDIDDAWSQMVYGISKANLLTPRAGSLVQAGLIQSQIMAGAGALGAIINGVNYVTVQVVPGAAINVSSSYQTREPVTDIENFTSFTLS